MFLSPFISFLQLHPQKFIKIHKPTFFTHNKIYSKPYIFLSPPHIFPLFQTNFNPTPKTLLVLSTFFSTLEFIFYIIFSTNFPHFYFSTFCSSQPLVIQFHIFIFSKIIEMYALYKFLLNPLLTSH